MCLEVLRILPPDRPLKVLDAGCGEGKDAVFFAKNGYKVSAFDITQSGIDKAKRLAERHFERLYHTRLRIAGNKTAEGV